MPAVPPPLNVTSQSLCTVLDSTGAVATQVWVSTVSARDDSTSVMLAFSGEIDRVAVQAIEDPIVVSWSAPRTC